METRRYGVLVVVPHSASYEVHQFEEREEEEDDGNRHLPYQVWIVR